MKRETTDGPSVAQPQPKMANGQWQIADMLADKRFAQAAQSFIGE
jgi:hypothetical protein